MGTRHNGQAITPLAEDEIAALDPGIRRTVVWLREHGFETSDSGDGISKLAAGDSEALEVPHVVMEVHKHDLIEEADRLTRILSEERSIEVAQTSAQPGAAPEIQASYDPANEIAIIVLLGLDDERLFGVRGAQASAMN